MSELSPKDALWRVMQKTLEIAEQGKGWPGEHFLNHCDEGTMAKEILQGTRVTHDDDLDDYKDAAASEADYADECMARIAALERERDDLAAQLAVASEAINTALTNNARPWPDVLKGALASLPERAEALREVAEAANELRTKGWTMTRENALYEAVAKLKETP